MSIPFYFTHRMHSYPHASAKHLSTVLSHFPSIPLTDALHAPSLKFTLSVLTAGDMALWTGPGRTVLSRAFEQRPALALELCGALAELNWRGWKLLALPLVLKYTGALLQTMPGKTLGLLAALERGGRLEKGVVDMVWRTRLEGWVQERFGEWVFGEENVGFAAGAYEKMSALTGSFLGAALARRPGTLESPAETRSFACADCRLVSST